MIAACAGQEILFFDLDGPLLDVSARYAALHGQLLAELGLEGLPGPVYWQRKRARWPEESILAECGAQVHAKSYVNRRLALIESPEYLALDRCWPWTRSILSRLAEGHTLVLVTARARRVLLEGQLVALDLNRYFREILCVAAGSRVDLQKAALIGDYLERHGRFGENNWMIG